MHLFLVASVGEESVKPMTLKQMFVRTRLGAPGIAPRSLLLGAPGLTTSNKKLLETRMTVELKSRI